MTMDESNIAARMLVLEREMANLKQSADAQIQRLDNAIGEVRAGLNQLGEKVDGRMAELRDTLANITNGALQSMPQWAVQSSERKNIIINTLTGIVCALIAGILALVVRHPI
jgi:phage tail tape-measure protein